MIELVTSVSLWELVKHAGTWVSNLKRAKQSRKLESTAALRKVVISSRKTAIYIRKQKQNPIRDIDAEGELSLLWTELSFELKDLKLDKLSERCFIKGKQWENPELADLLLLDKSDHSLEKIERIATQLLEEIEK
ncbi:hypothetical protein TW78_17230 [Vibrio coralliilyticus]|uniref:Uncharacterized protein n=1 Tax=Vibrio coralliilyticus TaxID=190893 RepID=A0A837G3J7_9VIBR|nr:hypothetical protein [Vibrio coralliilyticus]KJY69991.1 hypothetical protein TW78_17230 [Vibrio coralliilyticus]MCC2520541.1 hypothetical protein [Vibrio coralliilyticus]NOI57191.1 hypothetical protein [Vibrio coralliilyticus]NUW70716.1 hypothetical protein [Vibrio coralliilyticus]PAT69959.1 hypothetical protein CKA27_04130 [Vibrio coralliilyticus]